MISRHARIQDKKATRRGIFLLILSLLLLGALLFLGLPTLAKFAGLVVNLQESGKIPEAEDKTAPAPPIFYTNIPNITSERSLKLEGSTESGATVHIFLNDSKVKEFIVGENGNFETSLTLDNGENIIWAKARDQAGNESSESVRLKTTYDGDAPPLEIFEPADGASFSGEKSVTVRGKTEKGARVTVNKRLAIVSSEGEFSQKVTLTDGENTITVMVVDEGKNETEKTLKITYTP